MYVYYNIYDLGYINEQIKEAYKRLNRQIEMLKSFDLSGKDMYKKGYVKDILETIKENKKIKKDLLKKRAKLNAKLISSNTRYYSDDGQSGCNYWVFQKGCTKHDILHYLEVCYCLDIEGYSVNSIYDCTGKLCTDPVYITEKENTIVANQSWAYDV